MSGPLGFLNGIVTNLLNPFLAPAPNTPEPLTPVVWAVLAWVRRNVFNQAPTINYNPTTTVQTGQTVTGNLGASDSEGDQLTYTVTQGPQHGTLTIDQATGNFTYTPNDINYTAAQLDSFTVSVTDGKFNVLSLFSPRGEQASFGLTVLNPTVQRMIVDLPSGYVNPNTPRFSADGKSLYFAVTPPGGTRTEIHQVNVDGTDLRCVTCGLSPNITANLTRVAPGPDGRLMIQVATAPNSYVVYEPTTNQLVPVITPPSAARALDPQREMRISPDGKYVVFSQIQLGQTGNFTAVPVVGKLVRATNAVTGAAEYHIDDARVVFPVGEAKQWTPDGKGVIITGGQYEMGNVDDVVVDLATGKVTRLTTNLDYEEDVDMSPNLGWIAVGSTRTFDALTPMTRIVRPPFLPAQIQGAVYEAFAGTNATNVSNQEWLIAVEDELKGENGIPLFVADDPSTPEDEGDNYNARSMASWNTDGTSVAFWEAQAAPLGSPDPGVSRLVVANLQYTTSVGTVQGDLVTPDPTWAPTLSESVPTTLALPPVGTHAGAGGGTATITEVPDPTNAAATLRTVTYVDYVNVDGLILNGTESTSTTASQNTIRYYADITVSGAQTGYLRGDVTINKLTRKITPTTAGTNTPENPGSMIRSSLDGDLLVLLDPNRLAETRADA
ncbi:PD40 domain-containing protein [Mycobacterium sp. URHB0044]|uniref:Ig-like domain-containing protein n=1 Tax=Mycobacterium sp. URHB0044 TaxID=1380386 RepID=UPI00049064EF|nr:PD40 domain-containing protein [Mycobacterium sp. URHB0044]